MFTSILEMVVDAFASDIEEEEAITIAIVNPNGYKKLNRP